MFFRSCMTMLSVLCVFVSCAGVRNGGIRESRDALYVPGVYEGYGEGFSGTIAVEVGLSEHRILYIDITEHSEHPFTGGPALEELAASYGESEEEPDGVSGATLTSEGFFAALEDALSKARRGGEAPRKVF